MLPGLWVMLITTSIIILAAFSTVPPQANPGWWSYLVRNLLVQGGGYFIDGAFAANSEPNLVNGSLWTISREVQCYVALALLGALGLLKNRRLILILWLAGTAVHMALPKDLVPFLTELRWLSISFFAGVLISLWQDRLPISVPFAAALLLAAGTLAPSGDVRALAVALAAAYALITFGITAPAALKRLSDRLPDYSYGIYIYAFPAQQIAIATDLGTTPAVNMLIGFALCLPFAAASWHFIEKPALALKPAFSRPASIAATVSAPQTQHAAISRAAEPAPQPDYTGRQAPIAPARPD
jgi:peptidoglycan/LPS O-acetylase OafA/YrhL